MLARGGMQKETNKRKTLQVGGDRCWLTGRGNLRTTCPRSSEASIGRSFLDEGGEAGEGVGLGDAVMKIVEDIDPELVSRRNQCLEGIPSPNPLFGACLQTDVAFADALSGPELSRIIMQEDFRMGKHHKQLVFLCQRAPFALIELLVAAGLPEELIKLRPACLSLMRAGVLSVSQQVGIQLPEALGELLQEVAMVSKAWDQFLVMAIFMDPAESQFCGQAVELWGVVTE